MTPAPNDRGFSVSARPLSPRPLAPRNTLVIDVGQALDRRALRNLTRQGAAVHVSKDRSVLNTLVADAWDAGGRVVMLTREDIDTHPFSQIVQDAMARLRPLDLIVWIVDSRT